MVVAEMMSTHLSKFKFIVEDNSTGKCLFDELTSSFMEYREIEHKVVKCWGVHNTQDKTIVLYV